MTIGTLYDGNRKRLFGKGPNKFNKALDEKLCYKIMIYTKSPDAKKKQKLHNDDRLWALPETFDLTQAGMSKLLINLVNTIRAGNRVGLAASSQSLLDLSKEAIMNMLQDISGSA